MSCPSTNKIGHRRVLVNVPDLRVKGGVTNYFNALRLTEYGNISYFPVNRVAEGNWISKGFFLFFFYLKFIRRARQFDLVHLNVSLNFKSYYRDMGYILLLRLLGKKYIVFFHGWRSAFEAKINASSWQKTLFRHTYGKMDTCIVLGSKYEEKVRHLGVEKHCRFYLETTVADDTYINETDIRQKLTAHPPLTILFLARILEQKGVYIALDAFQCLKEGLSAEERASISLNIVGDGPELSRVKEYTSQQGMTNVIFSGYVQGRQKHDVLAASHILLFPTYYPEGQPCVNLEAMLYGMPVVTRAVAGVPDFLTHGDDGFLTLEKDPKVFAEFLKHLIRNPALHQKMGWNNHQRALSEFIPSQVVPRLLTIYRETINSPSRKKAPSYSMRKRSA